MSTPIGSIIRAATRLPNEPLNIICAPTHEAFETGLARTGHRFWAVRSSQVKDWNTKYRPVPPNYILLNPTRGQFQLPPEVDFDVVLSQNKFGQFQILAPLAQQLHLPLVSLEHTLAMPSWPKGQLEQMKQMRGDINVFISEFSRREWGWESNQAEVIHHGVDIDLFCPKTVVRKPYALSVVNDWKNRDWCCGFRLWQEVTKDLPVRVVGDTPGLSKPAPSTAALASEYQNASIFLNTSLISPVPTALLEAMATGCACVSTATCMIPEIIRNGQNGFISNDPAELRSFVQQLLDRPEEARWLGAAARQTILNRFTMDRFVSEWDTLLRAAANIVYKG